jgi:N-acetylglucosaminyldiphosphoundecaprenol N-acetyl-beta-D-mannosaminyltransferase
MIMFNNFRDLLEVGPHPVVFGMQISPLDTAGVARQIAANVPPDRRGARLFVTPNIQHIALMRRNAELQNAMRASDLITCDGFPVARFAQFRGCNLSGRVTGREVVDELMKNTQLASWHKLFFLVDSAETAAAVLAWSRKGVDQSGEGSEKRFAVEIEIAPQGFGTDEIYCAALAKRIASFQATILFLGVGAPRSELFAARYRRHLPDGCWALCIGQSLKITLGLVKLPPRAMRTIGMEWLWRLALEPRRLAGRYLNGALGFALYAVIDVCNAYFKQARWSDDADAIELEMSDLGYPVRNAPDLMLS